MHPLEPDLIATMMPSLGRVFACFCSSFCSHWTDHPFLASFVFLDVNPDATEVLQKPMEYMPYSGIAKGSKRGVFLPLLHVLLLFKNLKLQACELLL
jgi:hypothetical protein